ncbi:MAG: hypothetical protein G01um101416_464 [Microgenomates group bacterium Gr01-1014_16]|nr:MAG: hypothetical protein G01um101416_464 [Microgenomates group bacterium Gr01-1014_16]
MRLFERRALKKELPFGADWTEILERLIKEEPELEEEIGPHETPLSQARVKAERKVKFGLTKR